MSEFSDGAAFTQLLQRIMNSAGDLMALSGPPTPVETPAFHYPHRFERPYEFLQCLLDMVRVNYDPAPFGTYFLNSNMIFLYQGVPSGRFRLGYVSLISEEGSDFSTCWHEQALPYLRSCGYSVESAESLYAVVSTADKTWTPDLVDDVLATLESGFKVEEVLGMLGSHIASGQSEPVEHRNFAGFCTDEALGSRLRLSVWLFLKPDAPMVQ